MRTKRDRSLCSGSACPRSVGSGWAHTTDRPKPLGAVSGLEREPKHPECKSQVGLTVLGGPCVARCVYRKRATVVAARPVADGRREHSARETTSQM